MVLGEQKYHHSYAMAQQKCLGKYKQWYTENLLQRVNEGVRENDWECLEEEQEGEGETSEAAQTQRKGKIIKPDKEIVLGQFTLVSSFSDALAPHTHTQRERAMELRIVELNRRPETKLFKMLLIFLFVEPVCSRKEHPSRGKHDGCCWWNSLGTVELYTN